jgi:hypothetical protein
MLSETLQVIASLDARRPIELLPPELDRLFVKLADAADPNTAGLIEDEIWETWTRHPDPAAERAMNRAIAAIAGRHWDDAQGLLDDLVRAWPLWPEAWNKRATLAFLTGRDDDSARDIRRTLELEPRHFGAIAGFVQICLRSGQPAAALVASEAALSLHPHLQAMRVVRDRLAVTASSTRH